MLLEEAQESAGGINELSLHSSPSIICSGSNHYCGVSSRLCACLGQIQIWAQYYCVTVSHAARDTFRAGEYDPVGIGTQPNCDTFVGQSDLQYEQRL